MDSSQHGALEKVDYSSNILWLVWYLCSISVERVFDIGDYCILLTYIGIIKSQYKDPYQTASIYNGKYLKVSVAHWDRLKPMGPQWLLRPLAL